MTPEEQYNIDDDVFDFYAERDENDSDAMNFVTEGGGLCVKAKLYMRDVIILHEFLSNEIEDWLNS